MPKPAAALAAILLASAIAAPAAAFVTFDLPSLTFPADAGATVSGSTKTPSAADRK